MVGTSYNSDSLDEFWSTLEEVRIGTHYHRHSDLMHKTKHFCMSETLGMFRLLPAFVSISCYQTLGYTHRLSPSEGHPRTFDYKIMKNQWFHRYVFPQSGDANSVHTILHWRLVHGQCKDDWKIFSELSLRPMLLLWELPSIIQIPISTKHYLGFLSLSISYLWK